MFTLFLACRFALLLNTNVIGPTTQSAIPRDLYPAVGLHRVDYRDSLAAHAQPKRRHQLLADVVGTCRCDRRMAKFQAVGVADRYVYQYLGGISLLYGQPAWRVCKAFPMNSMRRAQLMAPMRQRLFRYITLPQLKPIIISLAMLDFIWTMQQFTLDLDDDGRWTDSRHGDAEYVYL